MLLLSKKWVSRLLPFSFWLLALSFFAYQFILRLWPGLMMPTIMQQFRIEATAFGMLASVYYYGYAGFQLPIAIALDRFGARWIISVCALIAGLSALLFHWTNDWSLALLSRFLIGASSAAGFLGVSKVISDWFPHDRYARMVGLSFSFGLMGAIYGGKPMTLLVEQMGAWAVVKGLAIVATMIAVCALVWLRKPPIHGSTQTSPPSARTSFQWRDLLPLLRSRSLWVLAITNLLMVGTLEGFADVWGIQYLITAHGLDKPTAAGLVSFIFVGMLFGGPLLAWLSHHFGEYKIIVVCGLGTCFIFLILAVLPFHGIGFAGLFFSLGLLCCYQVIIFSAGSQWVPTHLLGVTVAFLNCINMLGGSFFHTFIGSLMDWQWAGQMTKTGMRQYTLESYYYGLSLIPVSALIGALLVIGLTYTLRCEVLQD